MIPPVSLVESAFAWIGVIQELFECIVAHMLCKDDMVEKGHLGLSTPECYVVEGIDVLVRREAPRQPDHEGK
jgi:hypothetical protein